MPNPSLSAVADESSRPRADELPRSMPPQTTAWHQRLIVHAGAYIVLLAAITMLLPLGASLTTDDGAYGGQVYALQQGAWELERPLPVVADANEGWANAAISPDGPLPYTTNPSYAVLLRLSADAIAALTGSEPETGSDNALGLQLLPILGALGAATVAWLLTSHWNRRVAPLAFWLVGFGPTLVNATSLWAHTLSSALAGVALLALVKLLAPRPHRPWPWVIAVIGAFSLALAGAALIRTESVFWIASLCLATAVIYHNRRAMLAASFGGGLAAAAWLGNRWWGLSIRSDRLPIENGAEAFEGGWLQSRIPAGWELLLTSLGSGPAVMPLVVAARGDHGLRRSQDPLRPTAEVGPPVAGRRRRALRPRAPHRSRPVPRWHDHGLPRRLPSILWATAKAPASQSPPGGRRHHRVRRCRCRAIRATASPSTGARPCSSARASASSPSSSPPSTPSSGGLQWGGRYLSMAYVPLAVAAALRAETLYRQLRLPLLALLILPTGVGLLASRTLHENHEAVIDVITEYPAEVVITDQAPAAAPRVARPADNGLPCRSLTTCRGPHDRPSRGRRRNDQHLGARFARGRRPGRLRDDRSQPPHHPPRARHREASGDHAPSVAAARPSPAARAAGP